MSRFSYLVMMYLTLASATAQANPVAILPPLAAERGLPRMILPPGGDIMPIPGAPVMDGGYDLPPIDDLYAWCNQVIPILQNGQIFATRYTALGREDMALDALENAINDALASENALGRAYTITGKTLFRGSSIIANLRREFSPFTPYAQTGVLNFAGAWVNLVLNVVTTLDNDLYLPYLEQSYGCGYACVPAGYGVLEFHRRYLDLARMELQLVTENLVQGYSPIGSPRLFLRAAQRIANAVASDINQNAYRTQYACLKFQLESLVRLIQSGINDPSMAPFLVRQTVDSINGFAIPMGGCPAPRRRR